jgi:hypothetical protein
MLPPPIISTYKTRDFMLSYLWYKHNQIFSRAVSNGRVHFDTDFAITSIVHVQKQLFAHSNNDFDSLSQLLAAQE